ncbi:hypothetical protein [Microbacterium sp. Clip185]|uniref:hypothetical protein n=1 Tax=Microbacterium sp. Clip185 TaxID=3025663 RepID=UPI0023657535|nr:hypothetical protein [Microbacterium sp. Clip185]WDG16857.1 hypothetical protein PQV94_09380 [Microbacterium sp. Clip185]
MEPTIPCSHNDLFDRRVLFDRLDRTAHDPASVRLTGAEDVIYPCHVVPPVPRETTLVVVNWALAGPALADLFTQAIDRVSGF